MNKNSGSEVVANTAQARASQSKESRDDAIHNHDNDAGTNEHLRGSGDNANGQKRKPALEPTADLSSIPHPAEHARGRNEHISGSGRWREKHQERRFGSQPVAQRDAESHKRRRVHRDEGSPRTLAASIAASVSRSVGEQDDAGYESSPSDYSEIWNDYHSPSEDNDGADREFQETYDRLCAHPPQPPLATPVALRYGSHSSWNAHAFNAPNRFEDDVAGP